MYQLNNSRESNGGSLTPHKALKTVTNFCAYQTRQTALGILDQVMEYLETPIPPTPIPRNPKNSRQFLKFLDHIFGTLFGTLSMGH